MLIDDLLGADNGGIENDACRLVIGAMRKEAVIFRIDNVAELFWSEAREHVDLAVDYPNLAPPYNVFWMEYAYPRRVALDDGRMLDVPPDATGIRVGVAVLVDDLGAFGEWHDARWRLNMVLFFGQSDQSVIMPRFTAQIGVAANGALGHKPDGQSLFRMIADPALAQDRDMLETARKMALMFHPVYFAISLLHCRNVAVSEAGGRRTVSGKRRRRPTLRHYILDIAPMREILKREGRMNAVGVKKALHTVRGHFRDYTSGRGLFGKLRGMFWVPNFERGSRNFGEIFKEYNIEVGDGR